MTLTPSLTIAGRLLGPAMVLTLGLCGCAWVGQSAFEEKRASLDQDGDGALFDGDNKDCDDNNPERFPGNPEVPYDGWDNDCEEGDVVDIDGDGFPGITRAEYEANNPDGEPWPVGVDEDQVDCLDDPDVHPQARQIFPGNPQDVKYDGIDSDCAGDDDFDFDGDGFLPPTFALDGTVYDTEPAWQAYVDQWGLAIARPPFTDCDDFEADVNPETTVVDAWYDGVDQDCDGTNDFDADGDGWMPDEALHASQYQLFLENFHGGVAPWTASWGDCLDQPDPGIPQAVPADVYPGSPLEVPYDGVDQNCNDGEGVENDFDQDADGAMPDTANQSSANPHGATFDEYVIDWGLSFSNVRFDDCDDTNPDVGPGSLERLGDDKDADCSGDNDLTPFGFAGYRWEDPRPPRIIRTDNHYLVGTATDEVVYEGNTTRNVGVALVFGVDSGYNATPLDKGGKSHFEGLTNPQPMEGAVELLSGGDRYWGVTSYSNPTLEWTFVTNREMRWNETEEVYISASPRYGSTEWLMRGTDIDAALDDSNYVWEVSCGLYAGIADIDGDQIPDFDVTAAGALLAMRSDIDGSLTAYKGPLPGNSFTGEENYEVCFLESEPDLVSETLVFSACDPTPEGEGVYLEGQSTPVCQTYEFDGVAGTVTADPYDDFWALQNIATADYRDGWVIVTHTTAGGGGMTIYEDRVPRFGKLLDGKDLMWASAAFDADGYGVTDDLYLVTVSRPSPGAVPIVELHYGDPATGLTTIDLKFSDPERPELEPMAAAIYADEDRLVVAVSANNPEDSKASAVGWLFLGWPQ